MSGYPPPPSAPVSAAESVGDALPPVTAQNDAQAVVVGVGTVDSPHMQQQSHQETYDNGLASSIAQATAAAAAHHGLQALQAATANANVMSGAAPGQMTSPVQAQYSPLPLAYVSMNPGAPGQSPLHANPKLTRLRRACDMCSQRKVKCDEQHPCKPCRDLNVDCTFNREMKRRGPPNKHAEAAKAAKQPRLEPNLSPGPQNAAQTLVSIAVQDSQGVLNAESIAPWGVLVLLVDDFFTYIHPLAPFPHEPTFRQAFHRRDDKINREFLALLASMIGCLVASFPRSARLHLKAQHPGMNLFPKAISLVNRCRMVALEARGHSFYNKDDITVHDAATSYFLGLAAGYTLQRKICRRFMTETMSFIREMGFHRPRDIGSAILGHYRGPPPATDYIQDQMGKRIFWVMLLGIRSMVQLGAVQGDIVLPPPTPKDPYPEYPLEVDDQYILCDQILGQPPGSVSLLSGFIAAIKIYMTMNPLVSVELAYGVNSLEFKDQKTMLADCLDAVKHVTTELAQELTLDLNSGPVLQGLAAPSAGGNNNFAPSSSPSGPDFFDANGFSYYPPAFPGHQPPTDIRHIIQNQPERRRMLQFEIQKANIYVSQVATRSHYVELYLNLRDAHREHTRAQAEQASFADAEGDGDSESKAVAAAAAAVQAAVEQGDPVDAHMTAERELIVQHLLTVLASIHQRNLEPNGTSLINKVRLVASTLLKDAPERRGPVAVRASDSLERFVDILMRLEKTGPGTANLLSGGTMTPQDEEEELRNWADLREQQMRFYQNGGFLAEL